MTLDRDLPAPSIPSRPSYMYIQSPSSLVQSRPDRGTRAMQINVLVTHPSRYRTTTHYALLSSVYH